MNKLNRAKGWCIIFIFLTLNLTSPVNAAAATHNPESKSTSTFEKIVSWYMDNMNYGTVM